MTSVRKRERQIRRKIAFKKLEGPFAVRHDKRTWASHNGGQPLEKGAVKLLKLFPLKKYPSAVDVKTARRISSALKQKEES